MTRTQRVSALGGLIAVALALVVALPGVGHAGTYDATLWCPNGYASWQIDLPLSGSDRQSLFYVRYNQGGWRTTTYYHTTPFVQEYWDGAARRWSPLRFGSAPVFEAVGGNVLVEAFEYRWSAGYTGWINLGSCRTASFSISSSPLVNFTG